jgi:exopolyphosphatase/guanosine-5'-triphosphate,3'-diphosphate pyrophosphatase
LAIPGQTEAELIALAVQHGLAIGEDPVLVMDIGGGSTEFIICNQRDVFFLDSKKLGDSRIYSEFVSSDPLSKKDIRHLESF